MNSSINWELRIRDRIWRDIEKFPSKYKEKIVEIIEKEIAVNPYFGDIEKMKGEENSWRRRIGVYRVFYEIIPSEKVIYIFRIERRTSKTY